MEAFARARGVHACPQALRAALGGAGPVASPPSPSAAPPLDPSKHLAWVQRLSGLAAAAVSPLPCAPW